ncbi:hypothetical protein [Streptomyces sp. NPDC013457]
MKRRISLRFRVTVGVEDAANLLRHPDGCISEENLVAVENV